MNEETTTERAGFVTQEKVNIKDKDTGKESVLYKTYFLTSDRKLLTYWLTFPVDIESSLPACDIVLEKRISRDGKFELKVKDVLVA